ncbi:phage holin family protein [Bacillus sp. FJAT-49736]|uniref:phage holin family protein n=1 Tax=Bacillus sp. FJAT-49736 TaxID=2833582 RepID=UPI001BC8E76D|nr:phage holin family protein [Bacillus sp. FJAT-49736]MBS4171952.1 phage holin family protein [Bacillus sp. FJAT-49736]
MDKIFKTIITVLGALVGYLWGWSPLLPILLIFVVLDYISGIMASATEGKLSSKIGFKSIPKKIMIFVMVAIAHLIDGAFGNNHMFRDAAIFFYLANELLSITENAGRIGLPVPEQLLKAIDVLKGKSKGENQ